MTSRFLILDLLEGGGSVWVVPGGLAGLTEGDYRAEILRDKLAEILALRDQLFLGEQDYHYAIWNLSDASDPLPLE